MNGYTPSSKAPRKKTLGLSQKEYSKVTNTIKSVRGHGHLRGDDIDGVEVGVRRPSNVNPRSPYNDNDSSFIAETSFIRAPLNSRVPSFSGGSTPKRSLPQSQSKGKGKAYPQSHTPSLDRVPLEIQQALILEDLLFVLMGTEGTYITYPPDYSPEEEDPLVGIKFVVCDELDPSLRDLTLRILPLGTYYTAISSFIEARSSLEYGLVNHALCAGIRGMLGDYQTLLAQLEHQFHTSASFSLQKMWFYIHPTMHTLSLLYHLTLEVSSTSDPSRSRGLGDGENASDEDEESEEDPEEAARNEALGLGGAKLKALLSSKPSALSPSEQTPTKGGELLSILHTLLSSHSGDPSASALFSSLHALAAKPYVKILRNWVEKGRLEDRWDEVLVKENKFIGREILESDLLGEYWGRRYVLRDALPSSTHQSTHHSSHLPSSTMGLGLGGGVGVPTPRWVGGRLPGGACVPPLLEPWKFKILLAGKYLNVIRECGIDVGGRDEKGKGKDKEREEEDKEEEELGMDDERFYTLLESSYTHANLTLLHLLLHSSHGQLLPRLRSLKRFFFLSEGAFLTHFLDVASAELRKPARGGGSRGVSLVKLQSLLEGVLGDGDEGVNASASAKEKMDADADEGEGEGVGKDRDKEENRSFKEDLKVVMADMGLYDFLLKVVGTGGVGEEESKKEKDEKEGGKEKKDDKKVLLAIDALSFDYTVKFPLSLVISRRSLTLYQLLFRFLLHLKHVEMALSSMWNDQSTGVWRCRVPGTVRGASRVATEKAESRAESRASNASHDPSAPARSQTPLPSAPTPTPAPAPQQHEFQTWRLRVCLLRARMLSFIQQILSFCTYEVLEPNWQKLEKKLALGVGGGIGGVGVKTVDELLRDHVDFLDTCMKACMLTSSKLIKACSKLIVVCQTFAFYSASFTKSCNQALTALSAGETDDASTGKTKRWDVLNKFEANFNHWFQIHLDCVQFYASSDNVALLPLVVRLNSVKSA